jgi:hypothetical protein
MNIVPIMLFAEKHSALLGHFVHDRLMRANFWRF